MEDPLYSKKGACAYLGGEEPLSPRTIERMMEQDTSPTFIRVGRQIRFRRSDLEAWIAQARLDSRSWFG